ncbi:hypothetical protein F511_32716 [Dorcoceras hygrometricum]|uniref:No apical meristem-associated C-terminal domain-containing protein n=1 Tax=Dorcoceras hygrometricum TaxID=472368 RepID=A0A2Z7C2U5_9LAMI|nr:hypothetical protein F511_32716 [Dorcoceras hygrometricum]
MQMDGLPDELSSYPRSDFPSGYHLSSGDCDVLSMQMDGLPDELSSYPRSDFPSGYHLSSGGSEEKKKLEIRQQKIALATLQEENKILYMDLTTIGDPEVREMVRKERAKILQKRNEAHDQREHDAFGNYFGDCGGSGSNLGDY